jgi:peroxiredoxin
MDGITAMSSTRQSSQWKKYTLLSLALLGLGIAFAFSISNKLQPSTQNSQAASSAESSSSGNLEGQLAPSFSLKRFDGKSVNLADYRGKIVFLNFWATWCEPCKEEMPSMQRLYKKMQGRPFEILAVSLDQGGKSVVDAFLKKMKEPLTFPILNDSEQAVSKSLYHTTGVPETFIIGGDGKVIKHVIGSYEWDNEQISAYFEGLLKKNTVAGNG